MTLNETIKYCEDVADYDCYNDDQMKCAREHLQLAEWLLELKGLRKQITEMKKEKKSKWNPCSGEHLPSAQTDVIVSILDSSGDSTFEYVSCGWMTPDRKYWIVGNEVCFDVVAWMPFPEHY